MAAVVDEAFWVILRGPRRQFEQMGLLKYRGNFLTNYNWFFSPRMTAFSFLWCADILDALTYDVWNSDKIREIIATMYPPGRVRLGVKPAIKPLTRQIELMRELPRCAHCDIPLVERIQDVKGQGKNKNFCNADCKRGRRAAKARLATMAKRLTAYRDGCRTDQLQAN